MGFVAVIGATDFVLGSRRKNFPKKLRINSHSHQPRSDPEVASKSKSFFMFFIHF